MPEENKKILVTLGGECFEAEYVGKRVDGRDGVLYRFKLNDLIQDRGARNVSLVRSGTDRVLVENYDARIEIVRLNFLRRAFDSGNFSFEMPVVEDQYHELWLRATDFQPVKKSSDQIIRQFIKFGAYCLGYKHWPGNAPNLFVDFDCLEDLEYLGVKSQDIGRNVRLLTEEGYLRSSATTFDHPLRVLPTARLIREIENGHDAHSSKIGTVTQNFYLQGQNPRINMNSVDNSSNVVLPAIESGNSDRSRLTVGKRLRIRPIARRFKATGEELTQIDDIWMVQAARQDRIELVNVASSHIAAFGPDHIKELRTDPNVGSDGMLILKSQVSLKGAGVEIEPLV